MKTRVDINGFSDGRVFLSVWKDAEEIALPVIEWDFDESALKGWADNELNDSVALEKGMTSDDVSKILWEHQEEIEEEVARSGVALSELISYQLTNKFGEGTRYSIVTHDGKQPEEGLMYGNDECIALDGRLYTHFQPTDSWMVYRCYYTIPEGETDWSNIDYSNPEEIEVNDEWGYQE